MAALQAYAWPGNVRQLRNVVDWLLIMAPGEVHEPVRADMLPNEITAIAPTVVKWDRGSEIMTLPLRDAREVFEREYLLGPGDPLRRQHLAHRGLCRHGALGAAPQTEIARPIRQRPPAQGRNMSAGGWLEAHADAVQLISGRPRTRPSRRRATFLRVGTCV